MKNFRDLNLKKTYSSDKDDIINEFYLPTLSSSIRYDRLSGFFSSKSFLLSAIGILNLIKNNGIMNLILSKYIEEDDYYIITKNKEELDKYFNFNIYSDIINIQDEFLKSNLFALGWMLRYDRLKVKIALTKSGIFHQKVGILYDSENNIISFSGSVNETYNGWYNNIEEFKVFYSWDESNKEYIDDDISKFNRLWENKAKDTIIFDLPEAIKKRIIEITPSNYEEIEKEYKQEYKNKFFIQDSGIKPREYQIEAIKEWEKNNFKGIFEMATGTGKTLTSLFAIKYFLSKYNDKFLIIIFCPYQHLLDQWENSINRIFNKAYILKCYNNKNIWYKKLTRYLKDLLFDNLNLLFVLTTNKTGSSKLFIETINTDKIKKIIICDEVHNAGATNNKNIFNINTEIRLALSATPIRPYDEEGNKAILNYFEKSIYFLDIKKAIDMKFLVPYYYYIYFCELNDDEIEEYKCITKYLVKLINNNNVNEDSVNRVLLKRSRILSKATNKIEVFKNILNDIDELKNMLVFTAENKDFFYSTYKILKEKNIKTLKITSNINVLDRINIIKKLENNDIDCILAMRCVDEGVDIPLADKAIILASSTNYKQYIQRRGRVLRKDKYNRKNTAYIYDIFVIPPDFEDEIDRKIFERELKRVIEFSKISCNYNETFNKIYSFAKKNKILKNFINLF